MPLFPPRPATLPSVGAMPLQFLHIGYVVGTTVAAISPCDLARRTASNMDVLPGCSNPTMT